MISRAIVVLIAFALSYPLISHTSLAEPPLQDPLIASMIQQIDQSEIYNTVYSLQNFTTRYYGYSGNTEASTWLYNKLSNIPRLNVEYQGGEYRNVIATLPGMDKTSSSIYMVGAHYDSENSADLSLSPGATDNGGGVAIVLELARVMSQYTFNHTLKFALWNAEEGGASTSGSTDYAQYALTNSLNISLYFNYDSACYDPDNRHVLDIMYNQKSAWIKDLMTQYNTLYSIGFTPTYNVHTCTSDHRPFWDRDYTAVMTHAETHGTQYHTASDTIDKISTIYAKKNGQLGLSVLANLSEVLAPVDSQLDDIPPVAEAGPEQTVSEGTRATFDGSGSSDNIGIADYRWAFVDGTPIVLNGRSPSYTFNASGVYVVVLNVTDFAGNYATDELVITVNPDVVNPVADSGADRTVEVGEILTFDGSGSSDDVGVVSYEWDFGDGTTETDKTVTHSYSATGTFVVTLTVKDKSGNVDTDTLQVEVNSSIFVFDSTLIIAIVTVVIGIIAVGALIFLKRIR